MSLQATIMLICRAVKRIHWLRARAQKLRWQEELLLVTYEMQWVVRYFMHQSRMWNERARVSAGAGRHPGVIAYAYRHQSIWDQRTHRADQTFRDMNPQNKAPLS